MPRLAAFVVCCLLAFPAGTVAHPMGNFSINHYAGIRLTDGFIEIQYFIDLAEIPTFQEMQQTGIVPIPNDPRVTAYLTSRAETLGKGLLLTINGQPRALQVVSKNILFPMGAGNLPTTKLGVIYRAAATDNCAASKCVLSYRDTNFPDRIGWKEIVATPGQGTLIENSSVTSKDRSSQLSNYPADLISSPPGDLEARIVFSTTTAASAGSIVPAKSDSAKGTPHDAHIACGCSWSARQMGSDGLATFCGQPPANRTEAESAGNS